MFFKFSYDFDLVFNEYLPDQKKFMKQDMSLMCTPLSQRPYNFDDTYNNMIQKDESLDQSYALTAIVEDSILIKDHFNWRDRFLKIDALSVDKFKNDKILKHFSIKRLAKFCNENLPPEVFSGEPFNQARFLIESEWDFEDLGIWAGVEYEGTDSSFEKNDRYNIHELNRIDDRLIYSLLKYIFEKIVGFSQISVVPFMRAYRNANHITHDHLKDNTPMTYSAFYSDYLNIFNAIYQIKYFRNMTSELFEGLKPIKKKFTNDKKFETKREKIEGFEESIDKILSFPSNERYFHKRIANFLTGNDINEKVKINEKIYLKKLSDFSINLNFYRKLDHRDVKDSDKKAYLKFVNEFNEVIKSNLNDNYLIQNVFNDRENKFDQVQTNDFIVFIDQISEIEVPKFLSKQKFNNSLSIKQRIDLNLDQYGVFAELNTSKNSIFSEAAKLTTFKKSILEEYEAELANRGLENKY